jgi:hypothetical protein
MSGFFTEVRETLIPGRDSKDGLLPPLLVSMTVVTGLVDSFSYLVLGHVFVANMTGNIIFIAFALAGAPGFSVTSSVIALAGWDHRWASEESACSRGPQFYRCC